MKNILTILLLIGSFSLFAQKRGKEKQLYKENLSKVERSYTYNLDSLLNDNARDTQLVLTTQYDITKGLNFVLDSIAELNKNIKYIRGYKVLAYSGNSQEDALEIRKGILKSFEDQPDFTNIKTDFVWHQPSYRIYVGEYQKRLDAVRISEFLKTVDFKFEDEDFIINPLVVPDKIQIRE